MKQQTKRKASIFFLTVTILAFVLIVWYRQCCYGVGEDSRGKNPVVFVHGIYGGPGNFEVLKSYLVEQGWNKEEIYALDLPEKSYSETNNSRNGQCISDSIDEILNKSNSKKVDIVAHSMGGSNAMYYVTQLEGNRKVEHLITLGGANQITADYVPDGVKMTSIYSTDDMTVENEYSIVEGAENISISGVSHVSLLSDAKVLPLVKAALEK